MPSFFPHAHFSLFIFLPFSGEQEWTSRPSRKQVYLHFYANTEISIDVTLVTDEANVSLNPRYGFPVQTRRFRTKMVP
jgi:hypothetical protein